MAGKTELESAGIGPTEVLSPSSPPSSAASSPAASNGQTLDVDSRPSPGGEASNGSAAMAAMATASFPAGQLSLDSDGPADGMRTTKHEPGRGSTPGDAPDHAPQTGRRIGPYIVERELGRGGMGVVYLARHETLGRVVALKMILGGGQAGRDAQRRFLLEAQSIAKLSHSGIVSVFDIGEHEGLPYFSLEYVPGQSLADRPADDLLEPRAAASLVAKMAVAMQYAHDKGVLHRDLKPSNVLLADEETPKITDFGLAKQIEAADDSGLTQTGAIMGTPSYMSPEQARGDAEKVGPPTDQYALGAILYHLLAGRAPFVAPRSYAVIKQVLHDEPVAPRKLAPQTPADLETICLKALHKDSARRYANCQALADDLGRYLDGRPILARPAGPVERALRWSKRNPAIASAGAVASLALIAVLAVITWSNVELNKKNAAIGEAYAKLTEANKEIKTTNNQLTGANIKLEEQNDELVKANRRSKDSFKLLIDKARDTLGPYPQLRDVQRDLLVAAADGLASLPDDPADVDLRVGLERARSEALLYNTYMLAGEMSKAMRHIEKALAILEGRNVAQGTDATRLNLAATLLAKAQVRKTIDRDMGESLELHRRAIELFESILAKPIPTTFDEAEGSITPLTVRVNLLQARNAYTAGLWQQGQIALALSEARRNVDLLDETFRVTYQLNSLTAEKQQIERAGMAWVHQLRSIVALRAGEVAEAREQQEIALTSARLNHQVKPNYLYAQISLIDTIGFSGDLLAAEDDESKARAAYDEAVAVARQFYAKAPSFEGLRNSLNIVLIKLAGFEKRRGNDRHLALYDEAIVVARQMTAADPTGQSPKIALALSLAPRGLYLEASAIAEDLLASVKNPDAELLIDMARVYAQCSVATMPPQPEEPKYAERAVECVKRAIDQGYADWFFLKNHPDFAPLQSEPEFVALLPAEPEGSDPPG